MTEKFLHRNRNEFEEGYGHQHMSLTLSTYALESRMS